MAELENEVFLSRPFWFFFQEKNFAKICFISMKTSSPFIWGIIYFCTMDGFFRILEKTSSELICTRLLQQKLGFSHNRTTIVTYGGQKPADGFCGPLLLDLASFWPFSSPQTQTIWGHLWAVLCSNHRQFRARLH